MKKPPAWAFTFCVNLEGWEARLRQIDRGIAEGFYPINGDVISLPNVDGSTTEVTRAELDVWRKRVARLVAETEKRIEANDREWVFWLSEYARMKVETFTENFDELYTPAIEAHFKAVQSRKAATAAAAKRKKSRKLLKHIEKTGRVPKKYSDRSVRRLIAKKK